LTAMASSYPRRLDHGKLEANTGWKGPRKSAYSE
jgi:hypothetical protein